MAVRLTDTIRLSVSHVFKNFSNVYATTFHRSASCCIHPCLDCSLINKRVLTQQKGPSGLYLLRTTEQSSVISIRQYGRKVKPKPQRITFFEYSGDLRTLPEIDDKEILYPYLDHQEEIERDPIIKRLASLEFASVTERNRHMRQVIQDRIIELFGPDSELEQRIARFTLQIRQMIPYCIENRTDKLQKIWLLKSIFHRRRLLTRLRELDYERFEWLLRELKIRYVIPQDQEEWRGWKHNLREDTKDEKIALQRRKLEEFKSKLASEKEAFVEHKAKVLDAIDRDLDKFGLGRDFLDEVLTKEVEKRQPHKILTWEERVKLGMTDKIKEYYG